MDLSHEGRAEIVDEYGSCLLLEFLLYRCAPDRCPPDRCPPISETGCRDEEHPHQIDDIRHYIRPQLGEALELEKSVEAAFAHMAAYANTKLAGSWPLAGARTPRNEGCDA